MFITIPAYAVTYTYDELNRLTSATYDPENSITYTYDSTGNITDIVSTGDKNAPVIILDITGESGENDWYKSDVTLTITATDEESGVKNIEYILNEEPIAEYSEPLVFTEDSKNIIKITATDNYGNKSEETIQEIKIDKTAPEITIPVPQEPKFGDEYIVACEAIDAVSGIATTTITVNDQPVNTGDKINLQLGETIVKVIATDNAGNSTEKTATITVKDEIAPISTISLDGIMGQNEWYTSDVTAVITATDEGGSGVKETIYKLNNVQNTYTEPFSIDSEGTNNLEYYSIDNSENTEEKKTQEIKIDKTAPIITVDIPASEAWSKNDIQITTSCTDEISGIDLTQYAWTTDEAQEPEQWTTFSTNTITQSQNGAWYLHIKATDQAGNQTTDKYGPYNIDKTIPLTSVSLEERDWESEDIAVAPDFTDEGGSGLDQKQYAWSQEETVPANWLDYQESDLTQEQEGIWYLYLRATDNAGNEAINKYGPYKIDKTEPELNAEPAAQEWTNTTITVLPQIIDALSGIDIAQYSWSNSESEAGTMLEYNNGSIAIQDTGIWYLHLLAADKAVNTSTRVFGPYKIDKIAPQTTAEPEERDWENADIAVTPAFTDEGGSGLAETQYSWNIEDSPENWNDNSSGEIVQNQDGKWYLYLRAVDNAGNETINKYGIYKIDKTAPEITVEPETKDWTNQAITVQPEITEEMSGLSLAQYGWSNTAGIPEQLIPFTGGRLTIEETGEWYLYIEAVDNVGNTNNQTFGPYKIDKISPEVFADPENRDWLNQDAQVSPTYTDEGGSKLAETLYSWSIDPSSPASWKTYNENEITQEQEGEWYLFLKAIDNAGNSTINQYGEYKIDKTMPEIYYSYNNEYYYGDTILLQFEAADELSGIKETYVSFNGTRCENGTEVTIDQAGNNTIEMIAEDLAGNIRTETAQIEVIAQAEIELAPKAINLKNIDKGDSKVTLYIELPAGLSVNDINLETIRINDTIVPITDKQYGYIKNPVNDYDADGQLEFMAKFEKENLGSILIEGENTLTITGRTSYYRFIGEDTITAKSPGNNNKDEENNEKSKKNK